MNIKLAIPLLVILALIFIAILIESFIPGQSDSPEDSEVIVILGGGDQGRVQKAADLYESGYADKVLMTPAGTDTMLTNIHPSLVTTVSKKKR